MKQIKKIFTDLFEEHYKKVAELYDAHEKSISNMKEKNPAKCLMKDWITFHKRSEQIMIQSSS